MPTPNNPIRWLFLSLAGACIGIVGWAFCGLGLTELGLLHGFDPLGIADPPVPPSTWRRFVEWSLPAWALAGALLVPPILRWLTRSPEQIQSGRPPAKSVDRQ